MGTTEHHGEGLAPGAHHFSWSRGRASLPPPTGRSRRSRPLSLPRTPDQVEPPRAIVTPPPLPGPSRTTGATSAARGRRAPSPAADWIEPALEPDLEGLRGRPRLPSGEYTSWARVTYDGDGDVGLREEAPCGPEESEVVVDQGAREETISAVVDAGQAPPPPPVHPLGKRGRGSRLLSALSITALAALLAPGLLFALTRWLGGSAPVDPVPSTVAVSTARGGSPPTPRPVARAAPAAPSRGAVRAPHRRGAAGQIGLRRSPRPSRVRSNGPGARAPSEPPSSKEKEAAASFGALRVAALRDGKPTLASVHVDGRYVGQTPLRLQAAAGLHSVAAVLQGAAPVGRQVTLKASATEWVVFELGSGGAEHVKEAGEAPRPH